MRLNRFAALALAAAPLLLASAAPAGPRPTCAEHAKIELTAEAGDGRREVAYVDQTPPAWGKNPRPVLKVAAGEPVRLKWLFTNVYPHETIKDVVIHFYAARQGSVGQHELPDLSGETPPVLESACDLDLRPGGHAGGRATLAIAEPGAYLLRVESRRTQSDHEHFAAIDLVVEPAR